MPKTYFNNQELGDTMERADVVVIGAGVVGCSLAYQLMKGGPKKVILLEKNALPGQETSRRNSGVIHSGIHLPPASQKATFTRRGSQMVVRFCRDHYVPYRQVGMHVVVASYDVLGLWPEARNLVNMLRRAKEQDIPVRLVSGTSITKREPAVRALFGLYIPSVHIVDQEAFVQELYHSARVNGTDFQYNHEVVGLKRDNDTWVIETDRNIYRSPIVINCAGLYADRVAAFAGFSYRHYFYRGEYYRVDQEKSGLHINGLIYPVHQPGKPGLGVHLTPTVDGQFLLGPNARPVGSPTDYECDKTPAEDFHRDVVRFLPRLKPEHLSWAYSGIRCKLTNEQKENDFIISVDAHQPRLINCIGIESPGLTAAMAIAEHIVSLL